VRERERQSWALGWPGWLVWRLLFAAGCWLAAVAPLVCASPAPPSKSTLPSSLLSLSPAAATRLPLRPPRPTRSPCRVANSRHTTILTSSHLQFRPPTALPFEHHPLPSNSHECAPGGFWLRLRRRLRFHRPFRARFGCPPPRPCSKSSAHLRPPISSTTPSPSTCPRSPPTRPSTTTMLVCPASRPSTSPMPLLATPPTILQTSARDPCPTRHNGARCRL
jgi:hypothetical protein